MAVAVELPQEGDYLTDGKRLLFVVKRAEDEYLVEDARTGTTRVMNTGDLLRFRYVRKGSDGDG
jgi:hypothetical protein